MDEETPIKVERFDYKKKLNKHCLIMILHPDQLKVWNIIRRIKNNFEFHCGNIFSEDLKQAKEFFKETKDPIFNKVKYIDELLNVDDKKKLLIQDIYERQGKNYNVSVSFSSKQQKFLNDLPNTDEGKKERKKYYKKYEPLHFLPKNIFGNQLPEPLRDQINRCLIIPDSYFILHHPDYEIRKNNLLKSKHFRDLIQNCEKNNSLLRIISANNALEIPQAFFTKAEFIFNFNKKDEEHLKNLFKKLKLTKILTYENFTSNIVEQLTKEESGLVIEQKNIKFKSLTSGLIEEVTQHEFYTTTDRPPQQQ